MADFTPKKIEDISQLNGGKEYINEVDIPDADDWNKVINSQLWVQKLGENPVDNSEANQVGEAQITIAYLPNGTPYFKPKNLKGQGGGKGDKGEIGSLIYDDGITQGGTPEAAPTIPWSYLSTEDKNKILAHRIYDFEIVTFTDNRQGLYQIHAPTQTTLGLRRVAILTGKDGKNGTNGTNGTSVTVSNQSVTYQASSSGTIIPTGTWSDTVPSVTKGQYLWSRTIVNYSNETSTTTYNVAYQGKDGTTPTIDTEMSSTSTNTVQNKVIKAYVDNSIASAITTALNTPV